MSPKRTRKLTWNQCDALATNVIKHLDKEPTEARYDSVDGMYLALMISSKLGLPVNRGGPLTRDMVYCAGVFDQPLCDAIPEMGLDSYEIPLAVLVGTSITPESVVYGMLSDDEPQFPWRPKV